MSSSQALNKPSYILGISAFYHDSAASLIKDGEIVAAAQEERFTRIKHDSSFPMKAIEYCLSHEGITIEDLSQIAFYEKTWIKFERLLETYLSYAPRGYFSFIKALPIWLKEKLWMGDRMKKLMGYEGELIYPEHHQSHAASAFFPSPYERAAILTIDGVGEWASVTWGVGNSNKIELFSEIEFPHSLGLLYSAFTYYLGFKVNSGEYKVMGLAPYGRPVYKDLIFEHLVDLKEDGSFRLNQKYFEYSQGLKMTSSAFSDLFDGPARKPESEITQREMDLAASVQAVTEEIVLRIARHVREQTGEKNLVLAGGVALNCVANGKILRENIFDSIWIQPAAGDAGAALGAALYAWHQVLDKPRKVQTPDFQRGTYLGPSYSNAEVEDYLISVGAKYDSYGDSSGLVEKVASDLSEGKVVAWFQGRMEFGPRALGGRSILGDPRNEEMQSKMNLKIKYRESFRPFAPSCLKGRVSDYFELEDESPYMLLVAPIKKNIRRDTEGKDEDLFGIEKLKVKRSELPAVTHVDYSARVQTVDSMTNQRYYNLLEEFEKLTTYPVLINTSFNVRGEPIVCSPEDAYRCFMRTEIDVLVLENFILYKNRQDKLEDESNWREVYELD